MSIANSRIEAKEIKLGDIFSEQFLFEIPIYQRPFSWTQENFEELIEDISDALEARIGEYFLGSLVLKELGEREYEVVDGQQRLTSLTILLAVIRDIIENSELKSDIHSYIYEKGQKLKNIPARMRVKPWKELEKIFEKYIYKEGGTKEFLDLFRKGNIRYVDKQDPVYHIYEAIETFSKTLSAMSEEDIITFLKYLLNNVYFVYIKTSSRTSAFRLFNVLNTRGLPLSTFDILKSENLEAISNDKDREVYAAKWRALEEDIGRDELDNLIGFVRMILSKEKAKLSMYEEYKKLFKNNKIKKGKDFFDYIIRTAEIYKDKVLNATIQTKNTELKNHYRILVSLMRDYLPFSDWIPPLIAYYDKFKRDDLLRDFILALEKKVILEWCANFTATERITSMARVIKIIDEVNNPHDVIQKMFMYKEDDEKTKGRKSRILDFTNRSEIEKYLIKKADDPQFYSLHGGKFAKYILLRIDMELWDIENFAGYTGNITVEHILPRNPPANSEWVNKFTEEERKEWTNKLGNLVLLSGRKNSRASTYDFQKKKDVYFKDRCAPFRLTQEIMKYNDWNMDSLKDRHACLLKKLKDIYILTL